MAIRTNTKSTSCQIRPGDYLLELAVGSSSASDSCCHWSSQSKTWPLSNDFNLVSCVVHKQTDKQTEQQNGLPQVLVELIVHVAQLPPYLRDAG